MKDFLFLILLLAICGCATTKGINKEYDRVGWSDGISKKEAGIIAQKYIIESVYRDFYMSNFPQYGTKKQLGELKNIDKYNNHWFVGFGAKLPTSKEIKHVPDDVAAVIQDKLFIYSFYVLAINKDDGKIEELGIIVGNLGW